MFQRPQLQRLLKVSEIYFEHLVKSLVKFHYIPYVLVCPDDSEPIDSNDGGFNIELTGMGDTDQSAEDAIGSYLGTGLEISAGNGLKLTSLCDSGSGTILSLMFDVSDISQVNVTFVSPTLGSITRTVCYTTVEIFSINVSGFNVWNIEYKNFCREISMILP